jgi:YD repeat-containing protein
MLVNGSDTHTYTYDDIYQIETVDYPGGYSFSDDTTFNYDDVGNRSSVVESGTTNYSANNLNQYDYVGSVYYDYDENGNTTYDGVAYYSYDSENRLISATNADGSTGGGGELKVCGPFSRSSSWIHSRFDVHFNSRFPGPVQFTQRSTTVDAIV